MAKLQELKAQVYDLLFELQQHQARVQVITEEINTLNKIISEGTFEEQVEENI